MKKFVLLAGLILLLTLLSVNRSSAQSVAQTTNVTVVYNNSQTNSDFENVTKFFFSNGNLMIDQSGIVTSIPVETVRRLELDAVSTPVDGVGEWDENSVLIYPNPTSDKLYFSASQEREILVTIFSLSGQLLRKEQVSTSESVDVSSLSKGIYVIKIDDKTYKFSKL